MTQEETVLFQKRDYTIHFDTAQPHAGETLFTGSEIMIRMAVGSIITPLFRCREYVDNESVPLNLSGKTVDFYCKQYLTSTEIDQGGVPEEVSKACTIVSAVDGHVEVELDSNADFSDAKGIYRGHLIINDGADKDYSNYPFQLEIFEPGD